VAKRYEMRLTVSPTWATRPSIRRTVAALNGPTWPTAVICMPSATTIITIVITIVITPVVVPIANANMYARHVDVDTLCLNRGSRSDSRRPDKTHRNNNFAQSSHNCSSFCQEEITRNRLDSCMNGT
jgi:hypothetical protein